MTSFSAPKSVSALWALADRDLAGQLVAAHRAAVRASIDYLDDHAAFSRTGTDGLVQVGRSGLTVAMFDHRTSRAGDPQLHTHALVLNKVRCAVGGWRTVDGAEVFRHKKSAGMLYQAGLRAELTRRLGVTFTAVTEHGQAEIAGIPRELMTAWSTRTGQIRADADPALAAYTQTLGRELTGAERARIVKTSVLATRPAKEHPTVETLHGRWAAQAAQHGCNGPALLAGVRQAAESSARAIRSATGAEPHWRARIDDQALAEVGGRLSVFGRSEVAGQLAATLPASPEAADGIRRRVEALTDQALAGAEAVAVRDAEPAGPARASDRRWTTVTLLAAEARILHRAAAGRKRDRLPVHPSAAAHCAVQAGLDADQQAAVIQLTGSTDPMSVLIAPAGTGKTTTLAAATRAWTAFGYRVVGLAPTARAAAELAAATRTPADTLAKWLHAQDRLPGASAEHQRKWAPTGRTVLLIDEAGQVGTHSLDRLTADATAAGARVVLIGDPAQLDPIRAPGGMLALLADRQTAARLDTVHRFIQPWEATASRQLRDGNPAALAGYAAAGRIHPAASLDTALDAVHSQWVDASTAGRTVLMMARSRTDVDALNDRARSAALADGTVHGPALTTGDTEWRAGDQLLARRNNRTIPLGGGHLRNGDRFTVLAASTDGGLLVDDLSGRGRTLLPADYVQRHTAYGWASTRRRRPGRHRRRRDPARPPRHRPRTPLRRAHPRPARQPRPRHCGLGRLSNRPATAPSDRAASGRRPSRRPTQHEQPAGGP